MKRKIVSSLLLVLGILYGCSTPQDSRQSVIRINYSSDALLLVETVEAVHPIFITDGLFPGNYSDVRQVFLDETSQPLTKDEFTLAVQKYMIVLRDGHMGSWLRDKSRFLRISWTSVDGKLYLNDENGLAGTIEVTAIGGVLMSEVFDTISVYNYFENDVDRNFQYEVFSRDEVILSLAGAQIENGSTTISLFDSVSGEVSSQEKTFLLASLWGIIGYTDLRSPVSSSLKDDVLYIEVQTFRDNILFDETVSIIEDAISDGVRCFVIDVRNNAGGNSGNAIKLLEAMGFSDLPVYGVARRISGLAKEQRDSIDENVASSEIGSIFKIEPSLTTVKNAHGVYLCVLINENTFSSATYLGALVQDGNFGCIIGSPSRNSPTMFGDLLTVSLPVSNLSISISYSIFYRPDSQADQNTLQPDILVHSVDALDAALKYFKTIVP